MTWEWVGPLTRMRNKKYCPWASEGWKEALLCSFSPEQAEIERVQRGEGERCAGTHKWANLKFRPRFWATLHCCSVAPHQQRGWSRRTRVGKHSSKTATLLGGGEEINVAYRDTGHKCLVLLLLHVPYTVSVLQLKSLRFTTSACCSIPLYLRCKSWVPLLQLFKNVWVLSY